MVVEAEVNLVACQMTVELFGNERKEFTTEINEWSGKHVAAVTKG